MEGFHISNYSARGQRKRRLWHGPAHVTRSKCRIYFPLDRCTRKKRSGLVKEETFREWGEHHGDESNTNPCTKNNLYGNRTRCLLWLGYEQNQPGSNLVHLQIRYGYKPPGPLGGRDAMDGSFLGANN